MGILALAVLLIMGVVQGVRVGIKKIKQWEMAQVRENELYQKRMEEPTFKPPLPCPASALGVVLSHASPVIYVGAGDKMSLELRNVGKKACTVLVDPQKVGVEIKSGNQIVYDSTKCLTAKPVERQLLLDVNMAWKQDLTWNGIVQNGDCTPSSQQAAAGTYRFTPLWNGAPKGDESVLVLQNPPPEPTQADTGEKTANLG